MRAIDADALEERFADRNNGCAGECECCGHYISDKWRKGWCGLIADAPTIGGWISVKDRLPNHNNRVPVLYRFADENLKSDELNTSMLWYVREPFCNGEAPHWERIGRYEYEVLYWYELPEPPKED